MRRTLTAFFCLVLFASCGGSSDGDFPDDVPTNLPPTISRIDPSTAARGDEISIFGFGFSAAFANDIVIIGNASTQATSYNLVADPTSDEIEFITAIVPDDAELGENPVSVVVDDNTSNADLTMTVTP